MADFTFNIALGRVLELHTTECAPTTHPDPRFSSSPWPPQVSKATPS
jgi:hypothetical protein